MSLFVAFFNAALAAALRDFRGVEAVAGIKIEPALVVLEPNISEYQIKIVEKGAYSMRGAAMVCMAVEVEGTGITGLLVVLQAM